LPETIDKNIIIVSPPLWYYQSPPTDILRVAQVLHGHGIKFSIRDLNLESVEYIVSRYGLPKNLLKNYIMNEDNFFRYELLCKTYESIREAYNVASKPYHPTKLSLTRFETIHDKRCLESIVEIVNDETANPYREIFNILVPSILEGNPKIIAIALFHPDQIIPVFTLAHVLHMLGYEGHITLFGNYEDQICTRDLMGGDPKGLFEKVMQYFDSIIIGEFESTLVELVRRKALNGEIGDIRNLLTSKGIREYYEDIGKMDVEANLDRDYSKLLPKSDFLPRDVINLVISKGCYWSKCKYCSIKRHHGRYEIMPVGKAVDLLEYYSSLPRTEVVRFRDYCISPGYLRKFANEIMKRGVRAKWTCRARFEKGFDSVTFEMLREAGCIMLSYGIETFHWRVSREMNKGIDVNNSYNIIQECSRSDIAIKLTALCGFPTETTEEAEFNISRLLSMSNYVIDIQYNDGSSRFRVGDFHGFRSP